MKPITPSKDGSKPKLALEYGETLLAVVPEYAHGPGWSNAILWLHVRKGDGTLRTEALQPGERSREQDVLFRVLATAHDAMLGTIDVVKAKPKAAASKTPALKKSASRKKTAP